MGNANSLHHDRRDKEALRVFIDVRFIDFNLF